LKNLEKVLERCGEIDLVLNWEKCHFMVKQGIVLGHVISERGIEVDKAKIETVEKLPPLINIKLLSSFLGHARFLQKFIKAFSKITKPLTRLHHGARRRCPASTGTFTVLAPLSLAPPALLKPRRAAPFPLWLETRRRQAPGGHSPAVPRSAPTGSSSTQTKPPNRTLDPTPPSPARSRSATAAGLAGFRQAAPAGQPEGHIANPRIFLGSDSQKGNSIVKADLLNLVNCVENHRKFRKM
jgi:hypothetical protein